MAISETASAPPSRLDTRRRLILAVLCLANFMVILDSQVTILAVPSIQSALQMTPGAAQWVLSANLITFGGMLLLGGRAADLLGRRRVFMAGTVLFLIVSLVSGLAWNGEVLIIARALHGVSAALMAPTALSILTSEFPEGPHRHLALGAWAGIAGVGATIALLAGGVLVDALGWQWIFFLNIPVAIVMLVVSPLLLRESTDVTLRRRYDVAGALSSTAMLALLIYGVQLAPSAGWFAGRTLAVFGTAVALLILFVVIESRSEAPLLPLRILRSNFVVGGNLSMVTMGMLAVGVSVLVSQYAQGDLLGWSATEFGFRQAIMPFMAFAGSFIGQRFVTRYGTRAVAVVCLVLMGVGPAMMIFAVGAGGPFLMIFIAMFFFGSGLGLGTVAASAAALTGVRENDLGLASGMNTAAQQIGGGFGVAIVSTVLVSYSTGDTPRAAEMAGYQAGFVACIGFAILGLLVTVPLLRGVRRPQPRDPALEFAVHAD